MTMRRFANKDQSGIGSALDRVSLIDDGSSNQLVQYQWVGIDTRINQIFHPQVSGGLEMNDGSKAGDYAALDRYYRYIKQQWQTIAGTNYDQRLYTYDRMGNVLTMDENPAVTAGKTNWDETYSYDGLNRLTGFKRGTLSSGTIASPKFQQTWTLDTLGNWRAYSQTNNDTTLLPAAADFPTFSQTRTADAANEIGTVTGGSFAASSYDASGNQTLGPKTGAESTQIGYVYDGWNRLVGVDANHDGDLFDAGDVRYSYDGTGRRITKFTDSTNDSTNNAGSTEEYYQNEQNQVLEVRIGTVTGGTKTVSTNPKERYLWDAAYVDQPDMVELDTNTDGTRDYRLWPTVDANHNVTSLVTDGGKTVERYAYTPYGQRIILNGGSNYAGTGADADGTEYTVDTNGSDYGFLLGFQGLRFDPESGNNEADDRTSSPAQGDWTQRDPIQSSENLYEAYGSNPTDLVDPSGLKVDCDALLDQIKKKAQKLADKISKYDPVEDGKGGHPYSAGGVLRTTQPGKHFENILDRQRGLQNDINNFDDNCGCPPDPDKPPRIPKSIRDLAYQKLPQPVFGNNQPWWAKGGRSVSNAIDGTATVLYYGGIGLIVIGTAGAGAAAGGGGAGVAGSIGGEATASGSAAAAAAVLPGPPRTSGW